jgi:apolipoprotein D and lipocalin family protein
LSVRITLLTLFGATLLGGCQAKLPPLETVEYVDLNRFVGDWYVIGNIPTFVERGAHNAIESYRLEDDGTIATTFTFRKNAFDGPEKRYTPRGFVRNAQTNAEWGMQFIWPLKGDYRVIYLAEDYSLTIIGRSKRDHVWLMARSPVLADQQYEQAVDFIAAAGYDISQFKPVPQHW